MSCMLTSVDNPYNPFKEFDAWYNFDLDKERRNNAYVNCCSFIARIAQTLNIDDEIDSEEANEKIIDQILKYDFTNQYKKIYDTDSNVEIESPT